MTPKIGDIVHVRMKVKGGHLRYTSEELIPVTLHGVDDGSVLYVDRKNIMKIEERPLAVGDRVKVMKSFETLATVLHVINEDAWLRFDNGSQSVWSIDKLERAP